ncbi:MAG: flavodoxin family protein [Pseudanabaenaceae cyanobacterium]
MNTFTIVYFSGTGHTHLLAEASAERVGQVGPALLRLEGSQIVDGRFRDESFWEKLDAAKGIVFGSPTYMGGVAGQFKAFADATSERWFQRTWQDKLAGGFTHASGLSGDKQGTLIYLAILAAQHGMVWVGANDLTDPATGLNRLGSYLGVMGQSDFSGKPATLHEGDRLSAVR